MFDSLQAGKVEGVMLDRFKAYYYLHQLKNDHLRVALQLDVPLEYSIALIDKRFPELTAKNGCLAKYFSSAHHRLDKLTKHYINPVKVWLVVFNTLSLTKVMFVIHGTGCNPVQTSDQIGLLFTQPVPSPQNPDS